MLMFNESLIVSVSRLRIGQARVRFVESSHLRSGFGALRPVWMASKCEPKKSLLQFDRSGSTTDTENRVIIALFVVVVVATTTIRRWFRWRGQPRPRGFSHRLIGSCLSRIDRGASSSDVGETLRSMSSGSRSLHSGSCRCSVGDVYTPTTAAVTRPPFFVVLVLLRFLQHFR